MSRATLLEAEAEVQRQALRTQLEALRRQPGSALGQLDKGLAGLFFKRVILKRSPLVFYGWLLFRAWRAFSSGRKATASVRRSGLRSVTLPAARPITRIHPQSRP
jgi:hypothetical protein